MLLVRFGVPLIRRPTGRRRDAHSRRACALDLREERATGGAHGEPTPTAVRREARASYPVPVQAQGAQFGAARSPLECSSR